MPGARIIAIYDAVAENAERAAAIVMAEGQPRPAIVPNHGALCARPDVDLVYICSRWSDHVPHAVAAMEAGKHAAVEVPAAFSLADCWALVDTSERTRKHCVVRARPVCIHGVPREQLFASRWCHHQSLIYRVRLTRGGRGSAGGLGWLGLFGRCSRIAATARRR
eukprot:SAG22_NODE_1157_length_5331_cov_1.886086_6_plen_165_part_00